MSDWTDGSWSVKAARDKQNAMRLKEQRRVISWAEREHPKPQSMRITAATETPKGDWIIQYRGTSRVRLPDDVQFAWYLEDEGEDA